MHEFSIASMIVDALIELAEKQGATKIVAVHLQIGQLRSLSAEQVRFSYGILSEGTILEGSKLLIEEVTATVHCPKCGYESKLKSDEEMLYHFALPSMVCPQCGTALSVSGGDECTISKVTLELPGRDRTRKIEGET